MTTQLYRERQLWSGNEKVEIRYVNGSFVAGTSASPPGVPRHIHVYCTHLVLPKHTIPKVCMAYKLVQYKQSIQLWEEELQE